MSRHNVTREFNAIHTWHHDIGNKRIGRKSRGNVQRFLRVVRNPRVETTGAHYERHGIRDDLFIVHHEHPKMGGLRAHQDFLRIIGLGNSIIARTTTSTNKAFINGLSARERGTKTAPDSPPGLRAALKESDGIALRFEGREGQVSMIL